jgi:hypothetical protein
MLYIVQEDGFREQAADLPLRAAHESSRDNETRGVGGAKKLPQTKTQTKRRF